MSFNVVCFSICFCRLKIMATSHICSTPVIFTDCLHIILLFSVYFFPIYFSLYHPTSKYRHNSNQLIGIHLKLLLFHRYQIYALTCKYNPYMACIILCANSCDYLNEQTHLKQYVSERRYIHSFDKSDPCSFPWIDLVLEQK